jgi:Fe-Mn family superoxide dismutase
MLTDKCLFPKTIDMKLLKMTLLALILISGASIKAQDLKVKPQSEKVIHTFAPLPYAYDALEKSIDKQTMEIHYDRHHRAYYNNFLKAIEGTEMEYLTVNQLFTDMSKYPVGVRNNAGGYFNHTFFWNCMSPNGGGLPTGKIAEAINISYGSFDEFKNQFEKAAATRFGSGWAWLGVDINGKLFISSTPNQDNPLMDVADQKGTPILALDVWEHAYYLRYQNKRADYIKAFWDVANWDEVNKRYIDSVKQ